MPLWRVEEAAEYLGIRPKTLYEWVRLDRVPYRKIGFNVRFDPDELARWTEGQSRGGAAMKEASRGEERNETPAKKKPAKTKLAKKKLSEKERGEKGPGNDVNELLVGLAGDASTLLRGLERDVGTSLSFPQRRKLLDLADRLDRAASEARGS